MSIFRKVCGATAYLEGYSVAILFPLTLPVPFLEFSFLSFILSGIFPILSLKSFTFESQAIEKLQSLGT